MTDNQLINKIKQLKKEIKPEKNWVALCKSQILEQEGFKFPLISVFQNLFQTRRFLPVYTTVAVLMLLIVGIASFFILTEQDRPVEVAQTPAIILALEGLQAEVNRATGVLEGLKEPQKVLEARNTVIPTIEMARNLIAEVEKLELEQGIKTDNKILAVKESLEGLESAQKLTEARSAKYLIEFLQTRTLTESQQELLTKAEQNYAEGNYIEALINAIFVQQVAEK